VDRSGYTFVWRGACAKHLSFSRIKRNTRSARSLIFWPSKKCNQLHPRPVITIEQAPRRSNRTDNKKMKRNLLTLAAASAIALSGFAIAQAGPGWHGHGNHLDQIAETLNLTPDQKAKVQPIIDQAKPQMKAIHQEAMQKAKAVMESTMAQIRPLLTADQQQKFDDMKAAHAQMREAAKKLHDAQKE
jgi:Spy/CpxP family protein refolding chaperone